MKYPKPKHYSQGKIDSWDFIEANNMDFFEGNIIKYITRYKFKNGLEDLLKARTYLDKLIAKVRLEETGKTLEEATDEYFEDMNKQEEYKKPRCFPNSGLSKL